MKTMFRRKRTVIVAIVAALAAMGIGANAVLGGVTTPADTASPSAPSLPEGEAHATPPAAGYAQTGARLSDQQVAEVAQHEASLAGDATPGGQAATATMSAVNSTLKAALNTSPNTTAYDNPSTEALMKSEVVVTVLHGNFRLGSAPVPAGAPTPTGNTLTLTIDAHSGWVDHKELTNTEPALGALGAQRTLRIGVPSS
jgi:hypothetical protein